jgi:conjugative relaxase-like TrwC/TraI family protein
MQSTHKIAGADAEGFATYLTSENGRGDYYIDGEGSDGDGAEGVWHGSPGALAKLGLSADRPVQRDQLVALMSGQAPNDGREIRAVGGNGTKVAGIDLTYNAPKSVSALWAASSGEQRQAIERAHRDAVQSTLGHIERDVELVRTREAGQLKWSTANSLVAAQFMHTSSRLTRDQERGGVPDPHLHTHVVVLAAERNDGAFAAVDSRELFRSARVNGAWYRSQLAHNLQRAGLQIERGTGKDERYFELKGVPKELTERWSARTAQIEQAARDFKARYGRDPKGREISSLTTSTRGTKTTMAPANVDAAWKAVAAEHGLTREQTHAIFMTREQVSERPAERTLQPPVQAPDLAKEIAERVTANASMASDRDLMAIAYERSTGTVPPEQARLLVHDLERSGELIRLQDGLWTTRELREREQQTLATVQDRAGEHAAPVSEQALREAQRETMREIGAPLTAEQKQAVQTITGEGGVSVLIGQAGTGKGVVLKTATNAWQKDGYHVIGTAIAGATAERLAADAKTDRSMTTDALLLRAEKGTLNLGKDTVVVMDETGMADSKRLPDLVSLTNQSESKLILAGDSAQLSPIGAGGLFNEIADRAPTAELKEVHRAQNEWERKAWAHVREGEANKALAAYQAHDRLHTTENREHAIEQMLADWNEQRMSTAQGKTVILTDASNKELDRINEQAQALRAKAGELGANRATIPDGPYTLAAGDQIIFTKPMWIPGQDRVENGTLGSVKDIPGEHQLTVTTSGANERDVNVDTREHQHIRLSYAQHVYKAQGLTTDRALVLIGGWQTDRERAYVALTRAREQTNIYTSREDLGHQGLNTEAIDRLADRIEQSNAQQASITREPITADRAPTQTIEPNPETAPILTPAPSIEDGVGAVAPQDTPDPSPEIENERAEERSEQSDRDREQDQLTNEQQQNERDIERDQGFGLEIG